MAADISAAFEARNATTNDGLSRLRKASLTAVSSEISQRGQKEQFQRAQMEMDASEAEDLSPARAAAEVEDEPLTRACVRSLMDAANLHAIERQAVAALTPSPGDFPPDGTAPRPTAAATNVGRRRSAANRAGGGSAGGVARVASSRPLEAGVGTDRGCAKPKAPSSRPVAQGRLTSAVVAGESATAKAAAKRRVSPSRSISVPGEALSKVKGHSPRRLSSCADRVDSVGDTIEGLKLASTQDVASRETLQPGTLAAAAWEALQAASGGEGSFFSGNDLPMAMPEFQVTETAAAFAVAEESGSISSPSQSLDAPLSPGVASEMRLPTPPRHATPPLSPSSPATPGSPTPPVSHRSSPKAHPRTPPKSPGTSSRMSAPHPPSSALTAVTLGPPPPPPPPESAAASPAPTRLLGNLTSPRGVRASPAIVSPAVRVRNTSPQASANSLRAATAAALASPRADGFVGGMPRSPGFGACLSSSTGALHSPLRGAIGHYNPQAAPSARLSPRLGPARGRAVSPGGAKLAESMTQTNRTSSPTSALRSVLSEHLSGLLARGNVDQIAASHERSRGNANSAAAAVAAVTGLFAPKSVDSLADKGFGGCSESKVFSAALAAALGSAASGTVPAPAVSAAGHWDVPAHRPLPATAPAPAGGLKVLRDVTAHRSKPATATAPQGGLQAYAFGAGG
eukprot:TRINITY_DN64373_c0_g1_i1.p1 TRINITY_DN64373_c0_g1~~TRINITY_DN64373_c0_g1_i1.p1  ORF type:complete len:684 (-),score=116.20 TRINITY_DN64373_c0_g1_i1:260-2311(-)